MEHVKGHVDKYGKTKCQSTKCVNEIKQEIPLVHAHIYDHGFSTFYTVWIYRGETPNYSDSVKQFANMTRRRASEGTTSRELLM
jgi:hypothetical protein